MSTLQEKYMTNEKKKGDKMKWKNVMQQKMK